MTGHCSEHAHTIQTGLEILPDKLISFCFLLMLMTHECRQGLWILSNCCTAHKFTQHAISTVCDVSTSKIKQYLQYKEHFSPQFSMLAKTLWLCSPQIPSLAIIQLLFSVYSSEMCFISRVTHPAFFLFKILSTTQMFSFQMHHIPKSFSFWKN